MTLVKAKVTDEKSTSGNVRKLFTMFEGGKDKSVLYIKSKKPWKDLLLQIWQASALTIFFISYLFSSAFYTEKDAGVC